MFDATCVSAPQTFVYKESGAPTEISPCPCGFCGPPVLMPSGSASDESSDQINNASASYEDSLYDEDEWVPQAYDPADATMIEPIPADLTLQDKMHYDVLADIFCFRKREGSVWPDGLFTRVYIRKADCGLRGPEGIPFQPIPLHLALLAQSLRYDFPAGLVLLYLDHNHIQHARAGNATNPVCPSDAIAFMRKHGGATCGICFSKGYVAILEVQAWPTDMRATTRLVDLVTHGVKHVRRYFNIVGGS